MTRVIAVAIVAIAPVSLVALPVPPIVALALLASPLSLALHLGGRRHLLHARGLQRAGIRVGQSYPGVPLAQDWSCS